MNYHQLPPRAILKDLVRCYWWLDNDTNQNLQFTILPDGCFDLIISFENYEQKKISLTGIWSKQTKIDIPPNTQFFGIQFRLLAVDYIIQQHIAELFNNQKELENNYWNLNTISFFNNKKESIAEYLDQHLLRILQGQKEIDSKKIRLFRFLYQSKGNETTTYYAEQVFWSRRQITRYFKIRFGLSFKKYCNIIKCSSSFKHLKKGQLYPEQNYFDSSHFIKAIKKHTGSTPKELYANENDRFLQFCILPDT
ncbi:MAG: helix-turn-helix domain-containing protein [Bacteroidota bacterium]